MFLWINMSYSVDTVEKTKKIRNNNVDNVDKVVDKKRKRRERCGKRNDCRAFNKKNKNTVIFVLVVLLLGIFMVAGCLGDYAFYQKLKPFSNKAKVIDHPTKPQCTVYEYKDLVHNKGSDPTSTIYRLSNV